MQKKEEKVILTLENLLLALRHAKACRELMNARYEDDLVRNCDNLPVLIRVPNKMNISGFKKMNISGFSVKCFDLEDKQQLL